MILQFINYNQFISNSAKCLTLPESLKYLIQNMSGPRSNSQHMWMAGKRVKIRAPTVTTHFHLLLKFKTVYNSYMSQCKGTLVLFYSFNIKYTSYCINMVTEPPVQIMLVCKMQKIHLRDCTGYQVYSLINQLCRYLQYLNIGCGTRND
jgi:hypothetical protein